MGPEADVMLSMNSNNCARYGAGMEQPLTDAEAQLEQSMKDNYQSIWTDMLTAGTTGPEMCNYLDWAYYARVNLTGDMQTWIEIHNTVCKTYSDSVTQANIALEWSDDGLVSNAFNQKLLDIIRAGYAHEGKNIAAHRAVFFNFQTLTPDILSAIALSTENSSTQMPTAQETLPASSSIVLEVNKDGTIRGYLNDEEYILGGCAGKEGCQLSDFENHLQANVDKIPKITEYCKRSENIEILN